MKAVLFFFFTLCVFESIRADDGKYRPSYYGVDGRYLSNYYNGYNQFDRYRNFYGNNYYPYGAYQPLYYNHLRPYQSLVAPIDGSAKSVADNFVIKPAEVSKPAVSIINVPSTTVAPSVDGVAAVSTTALPRLVYAKIGNEGLARIVSQDSDLLNNGYHYSYQTENGINVAESGLVDSANTRGGTKVKGFYEYVGDNGLLYRVDYTADENGYQASGAHLP